VDSKRFRATYLSGIVFLLLMQLADIGTTYAFLGAKGMVFESNPFMQGVINDPLYVCSMKMLGVALVVLLAELMRRFGYVSLAHSIVWVVAGFSACVVWNNLMTMMIVVKWL
jgi:hypothetical protein